MRKLKARETKHARNMSERMIAAVKRAQRIKISNAFRCFLSKSNYITIYILSACIALFTIATTFNYICERQFRRLMFENRLHIQTLGIYRQSQGNVNQSISLTNNSTEKSTSSNQTYPVYITTTRTIQTRNKTRTQYPLTLNAPFLIENPELCSAAKTLSVLVIVHTAPNNFARREAIRSTWTNNTFYSDLGTVRTLFLLGTVQNQSVQQKLEEEFKKYSDILQGDFLDAYRNLTHKGVMAYKWITERCRNAKLILKVDDDVVVSMYTFFDEYFPLYKDKQKHILCNHIHPGTMPIIRNVKSKWYVDENQFKGEKLYPRYCSGFMVVFTNDIIPAIYRSASITPFFWVDDVYLYGLAPGHVPGITYKGIRPNSHQLSAAEALKCYANTTRTCDFLVTGARNPEEMNKIWTVMGQKYEANKKAKLIPFTNATQPHVQIYDVTTSSGVQLGNTTTGCHDCGNHTRIVPRNQSTTQEIVPHNQSTAQKIVRHNQSTTQEIVLHNQATAQEIVLHNQSTAQEIVLHNQSTAQEIILHNQATAQEIVPHNQSTAQEIVPAQEIVLHNQSTTRNSSTQPINHTRNSSTQPVNHNRNSFTQPVNRTRNSSTQPGNHTINSSAQPVNHTQNISTQLVNRRSNSTEQPHKK